MENQNPEKSKRETKFYDSFIDRNKQIFQLGIALAVLFTVIIFVSLLLEKERPMLVPIDQNEYEKTEIGDKPEEPHGVIPIKPAEESTESIENKENATEN